VVPYVVYMIQNKQGVLYTGVSTNPNARLQFHNMGLGAKFTRGKGPWKLVYIEREHTRSSALKREYRIKQLSKLDKLKLVESQVLT
jgi:putative endonuclease